MYVYRKSDFLRVAGIQNIEDFENEFNINIKRNVGGTESDYSTIETDLKRFHLETINGEVVAVEDGLTPEEQKRAILQELTQLDIEILRIVEDLIKHTNFKPHKTKEDAISKKVLLRQKLQELER